MKKIVITLFTGITAFFLSCEGLDQFPQDAIAPENFFTKGRDLELFTNAMYNMLPAGELPVCGEAVDNIICTSIPAEVQGSRIIATSAGGGGWSWSDLRRINMYLQNSPKCDDDAARRRYDGVAKFFRAYFYFNKVKRFGDVPWYNYVIESNNTEALQKPRDSRVLVVDSIVRDLDYAIANLPTARTVNEISKWTALALKARVCLFEGTFRKYHQQLELPGADNLLQQAADAAYELITQSGYSIFSATTTPYQDLFTSINPIASEIILARIYSNSLGIYHNVNYYLLTPAAGRPGLDKTFVNTYLTAAGTPFTDIPGYEMMQFFDEIQDRDPRLSQTIRTPGYKRIGETLELPPDLKATVSGYQLIKFLTSSQYDAFTRSINSMPIFRYAEVLLNYAEAKAELGTLEQSDIDISIKLLRDRVEMTNLNMATANATPDPYMAAQYPAVSGANKGVILEIRRERGVELVMEGFRWDDVMRWKAALFMIRTFKGMYFPGPGQFDLDQDGTIDVVIYTGDTPPTVTGSPAVLRLDEEIFLENGTAGGCIVVNGHIDKKFDEKRDYLFPIPIPDRLLNKNLTQNPGWDDGLNF